MNSRPTVIASFVLVLSVGIAEAGVDMPSPRRPQVPIAKQDIYSRNRAFVLDVDPLANRNTIYSAADRGTPLWSFPCNLDSDTREIFLADSGSTVAIVMESHWSRSRPGVEFHFRDRETISFGVREFLKPDTELFVSVGAPVCGGGGDGRVRWVDAAVDEGDQLVLTSIDDQKFVLDYESPRLTRQRIPTWAPVVGLVVAIFGVLVTLWIKYFSRAAATLSAE